MNRVQRLLTVALSAVLGLSCSAAWAQQDDNHARDDSSAKFLRFGRSDSPPAGATLLDWGEYTNMVLSGRAFQLAPQVVGMQKAKLEQRDAANRRTIEAFLDENPNLTGLAALFAASYKPSDTVQRYGQDWLFTLASGQQVVVMGRSFKLAGMADSIRQSTDPAAQLRLYTSWYNQLPAGVFDPATGIGNFPTPESLSDASLADIQRALGAVADKWAIIGSLEPIGPVLTEVDCNFEIGASSVHGDTQFFPPSNPNEQFGCGHHSSQGIFVNFDWPNKGYLTCVKDQGHRGTCHTFATISATEMEIGRTKGIGVNLSEQDEMEHLRLFWDPVDWYTDGEYPSQEIQLIQTNNYHFAYENKWDYNPSYSRVTLPNGYFEFSCDSPYPGSEPCSDTSPQAPLVCSSNGGSLYCSLVDAGIVESTHTITSGGNNFWNPKNPDLSVLYILLNLAFNNGVIYSFGVTDAFMGGGKGGFIPYNADDLKTGGDGHAVHVVGYISNQDLLAKLPLAPPGSGGGYFIIKNSWGPCWGDAGYGYLPVDYLKARAWEATAVAGVN